MIRLTIDGKVVKADSGVTILEAARQAGVDIPTLCYCEKIELPVSCFICVVKVNGQEKFVPSCATPAQDGMIVDCSSDEVRGCRKRSIELLMSAHSGSCYDCGKKDKCQLREFAIKYKANRLRYAVNSNSINPSARKVYDDSGLVHEPGKCILCGKCVNITKAKNITPGLAFNGRGSDVFVDAPFGCPVDKAMGEALEECVEACPTGALWRMKK
ncbi:MAG: (2Fe-2S)-binding protein [Chitinispirillales bacterium]|jgi:NADH dehydrogenase/NADH:ubiquinone oxidoreductase subunit G|nr:(2Fe-2S)-binding protein [Chitinispirillales bacterium]